MFFSLTDLFSVSKPASVGSVNGSRSHEDDNDSSTEDAPSVNGIVSRDGRSVSSTVHDRSRTTTSASAIPTGKQPSSSRHHHSQSHRHSIAHSESAGST